MEASKTTGKIQTIWKRLTNKEYRDVYTAGKVANDIAFQVYYLRAHQGWTQGELAARSGTKQPAISRLERSIGSMNVGTLLKVASAFRVGLSIKFVPFSKLVTEAIEERLDARVMPFDDDCLSYCDALPMNPDGLTPIRVNVSEPLFAPSFASATRIEVRETN